MVSVNSRIWEQAKRDDESPTERLFLEAAPDGTRDVLYSGTWSLHPSIPSESFPSELLLSPADHHLAPRGSRQILLAARQVGRHQVELLLCEGDTAATTLAVRIPTAKNQFHDPYIVMESESGNLAEDAVREIDFHLQGRVSPDDIRAVDWSSFLREAAATLQALRNDRRRHEE